MKISSFYLNSILAGMVALLTLVMVLLYIIKPGAEQYSHTGADNAPATYAEVQEIELQISRLEKLVASEKSQAAEQKAIQDGLIDGLRKQLSDIKVQLKESRATAQEHQQRLDQEKALTEQLNLELESAKTQAQAQASSLTSSGAEVQVLDKDLQREKNYSLSLRADYEAEKLKRVAIEDTLQQKKRELIRSKRALESSQKSLATKQRELTLSTSQNNDIRRKNESLNRKLSILNSNTGAIRQTSQDKAIVGSPSS